MKVKCGVEYTELSKNNMLRRFKRKAKLKDVGGWLQGPILQSFPIREEERATYLGKEVPSPATIYQDGDVRLTNDEYTAEWIIEGHLGEGRTLEEMKANIEQIFTMRKAVKAHLQKSKDFFEVTADEVVIQPIGAPPTSDVFLCNLHDVSSGAAQITVKYLNKKTLARISEVNISKHLAGGPIQDDIRYLKGKGTGAANALLGELIETSQPFGLSQKTYLTKEEMGLVKLMILSDTMAVLLTRYVADEDADTHEKNMQRYFPKARRPHYVHAAAGAALPDEILKLLRQKLMSEVDGMMKSIVFHADLGQLELQYILSKEHTEKPKEDPEKSGAQPKEKLTDSAYQLLDAQAGLRKGKSTGDQKLFLRNAIFGKDLAELRSRLTQVIAAYTELATEDNHSAVVSSKGYAKLDLKTEKPGGVYELRDREIAMGEGNVKGILQALEILLKVAE